MTSDPSVDIAEALARKMDMEDVIDHYDRTRDPQIKRRIEEVLLERRACPECGNDLLLDEAKRILYCPVDGWEGEL